MTLSRGGELSTAFLSYALKTEMSAAKQFVQSTIAAHKVVVFSKTFCPYCTKAKTALTGVGASFHLVELDHRNDGDELQNVLQEMTGARSVPRVFINGVCIGVSRSPPPPIAAAAAVESEQAGRPVTSSDGGDGAAGDARNQR